METRIDWNKGDDEKTVQVLMCIW